jgi:hypothetical protein
MFTCASDRLRTFVLVSFIFALWQANAAAQQANVLDSWRVENVTVIALRNRGEIAAANARADALAQRPAIVGALEDPMISPAIDHYPFDMPEEESEFRLERKHGSSLDSQENTKRLSTAVREHSMRNPAGCLRHSAYRAGAFVFKAQSARLHRARCTDLTALGSCSDRLQCGRGNKSQLSRA